MPWLLGQEGKDSEPGDRQGGACLHGLGLRSGPKEVNSSCSWQNRTSELMPLHWPAPSLLSAVPLLGMLFSSQYFLSTNIPIRIEPVLGPAAGLTGERPPRPGPRDRVRSGVSVRAGRTEPKTPAPSRACCVGSASPLLAWLTSPLWVYFLLCEIAFGGDDLREACENQESLPREGRSEPRAPSFALYPLCRPGPLRSHSAAPRSDSHPHSGSFGSSWPICGATGSQFCDLSRPGLSLDPAQRSPLSAPQCQNATTSCSHHP